MKKYVFVVTISLIAWCLLSAPRIVCTPTSLNLGTVSSASGGIYREFSLKNTGDESLAITDVNTSCGCLEVRWSQKTVAPGKTTTVGVIYTPEAQRGPFVKQVQVVTNASRIPLVLKIQGNVKAAPRDDLQIGAVVANVSTVDFGAVMRGDIRARQYRLRNSGKTPVDVELTLAVPYARLSTTKLHLNPGAEGLVNVQLDTTFRSLRNGETYTPNITVTVRDVQHTTRGQIGLHFRWFDLP